MRACVSVATHKNWCAVSMMKMMMIGVENIRFCLVSSVRKAENKIVNDVAFISLMEDKHGEKKKRSLRLRLQRRPSHLLL